MYKATGIIAEYNPFHNGHAYHMQKAREVSGCPYVVVVMSGDFVQRGAPALFDKHLRTKAALSCGADLVLELPVSCACQSAEFFASGAVSLLTFLGCIDSLCFGSEAGNLKELTTAAHILSEESSSYQTALKSQLKLGLSYPAARKEALKQVMPSWQDVSFMDSPNNILAVEYLKALERSKSTIKPYTIKREGNGFHDTDISSSLASAAAIRRYIRETSSLPADALPDSAADLIKKHSNVESPVWEDDFSLLLKYALMQNTCDSLTNYADMTMDLSRRIYHNLNSFSSFSQFTACLKTKELTYTRISRALLHVILNIRRTDIKIPCQIPYARVLGFRKTSAPLLREIKKHSLIPLITKAADYKKFLDAKSGDRFRQDLFAADLYETVRCHKNKTAFVNDLQKPPVIL